MHRLRRTLTPSMVVALLALFVALSGTAGAARYLITKQSQISPAVRKALRGKAGPTGPAGSAGVAGAPGAVGARGERGATGPSGATGPKGADGATGPSGQDGATGAKGTDGTPGLQGAPGAPGATGASIFDGPLPSGKTISGMVVSTGELSASNQTVRSSVSFPVPLQTPIDDSSAAQGTYGITGPGNGVVVAGGKDDGRCGGTADSPTPTAGRLCIYLQDAAGISNVDLVAGLGLGNTAHTRGFYLVGTSVANQAPTLRYVWVYRAP